MFSDFPDIALPAAGSLNGAKFESRSAMGRKARARSAIVERLNAEINSGLADKKIQAGLADFASLAMPMTPHRMRDIHSGRNQKVSQACEARGHQAGLSRPIADKLVASDDLRRSGPNGRRLRARHDVPGECW
jgi:hypothetical protein